MPGPEPNSPIFLDDDLDSLRAAVSKLKQEKQDLRNKLSEAVDSVKTFHKQQRQLYDGFKLLRSKYDDLKGHNAATLWEYIPKKLGGYEEVCESNLSIFETKDRIGQYKIGKILGEGQFADVRVCTHTDYEKTFAIKIMYKDKVHSVNSLRRINSEIAVLRRVRHTNIIKFHDAIISPKIVYLIVDLGGQDLFEFFDKHLDGVDDADARQIVLGIVRPISYIHQMGICHRDLKPENILLHAEPGQTIDVSMLKICDFGLCCQNIKKHDKGLSEFCGSPGFFAPEMILNGGRYNGLLVDVWSIGCIMLELTLGHDEFCKSWMTAYDYNSIQRESIFEDTITDAVEGLDLSKLSDDMQDMLNRVLVIDPDARSSSDELLKSCWLNDHESYTELHRNLLGESESKYSSDDSARRETMQSPLPQSQSESKDSQDSDSSNNNSRSGDASPAFLSNDSSQRNSALAEAKETETGSLHNGVPSHMKHEAALRHRVDSENDLQILNKMSPGREAKGIPKTHRRSETVNNPKLNQQQRTLSSSPLMRSAEAKENSAKFKDSLSLRARRHFAGSVETDMPKDISGRGGSSPTPLSALDTSPSSSLSSSLVSTRGGSGSGIWRGDGDGSRTPDGGVSHSTRNSHSFSPSNLNTPSSMKLSINTGSGHVDMHLPPIEPKTPSINSAKRMLNTSNKIMDKYNYNGSNSNSDDTRVEFNTRKKKIQREKSDNSIKELEDETSMSYDHQEAQDTDSGPDSGSRG